MMEKVNFLLFFKVFDYKDIVDLEIVLFDLDVVEEIIMIGYLNGLWDEKNNFLIFRKGIIVIYLVIDYNGWIEFFIDAVCFEGLSGLFVFLFDKIEILYKLDKERKNYREILLGILWVGEVMDVEGEIR